ncbi:MAG: glycosyltransferase family 39 protein [bacterium]
MFIIQILILFILFYLPGYLISSKKFQGEERFCFSFGFSILMYAGLAVVLHLFKIPILWSLAIFPLSFITLFFRRPDFNIPGNLLLIFGITLILYASVSTVSKFPITGDSYWHISLAKSFLTDKTWVVLPFTESYWSGIDKAFYAQYRPPLFNLILGFVFSIFGQSFEVAKLVVVLFIVSILLPIYLIAKKLYSEKCAIYSTILLITINPCFLASSFEITGPSSCVYFSLCLFYLYLKRDWNYVAIIGAGSYLLHPASLFLILSLILIELIRDRKVIFEVIKNRKIQIKASYFYPIFIFLLLISPWLIRNYLIFGNPVHTSGKYISITRTWQELLTLNPPTLKSYLEFILNPITFLQTKIGSLYLTFLPRPYSITFSTWDMQALWNPVRLNAALAGFLSYPLLVVVLYGIIKWSTKLIPSLFYLGLIICLCVSGPRAGYTGFLISQCVLLGIFGINIIINRKILISLIGIILILQSIYVVYDRYSQKEIPEQKLYSWIKNNTGSDEKIMICDAHAIAYWTGRKGFTTPNENMETILYCIKKWNIDYFIVGEPDLRLRNIDINRVEKEYKFLAETVGYRIYKI